MNKNDISFICTVEKVIYSIIEIYTMVNFKNQQIIPQVASKFQEFLKSKNQSSMLLLPDCLAFHLDGENDFIALNDVSPQGFGPAARQSTLTLDQIRTIIEAMARFHGISFAYKDQHEEHFKKISSKIFETYFSHELYDNWYKRFHVSIMISFLDSLYQSCH